MAEPRIAVVGCGGMGHNHTRAAVQELGARVVGGCDISPEARERFRLAWGTDDVYEAWDELYEKTRPDVVFVTTHGSFHAPATIAAAGAGCHVFCEKPMALSLAECDAMVEACDRNGVKLAINHIKRASGYNRLVRHLIASGDIGEVFAIQAYNKGARPSATEMTEMGTHIADWARVFAPDVQWAHGHVTVGGREATAADITPSTEIHGKHVDSGTVMGERMFATYGAAGGINISINFWMEADNDDRSYGLDIFGTQGTLCAAAERGHAAVPALRLAHVAGVQPPVGACADALGRRAERRAADEGGVARPAAGDHVPGPVGGDPGGSGAGVERSRGARGDGNDACGLGVAPAAGAGGFANECS